MLTLRVSKTAIIISGMQNNHLFFVRKAVVLKAKELLPDLSAII